MRTISLHQPHASAIPLLAKGVETRGWPYPPYRGPLAIHAAKRCVRRELQAYRQIPCWQAALAGTALMAETEPDYATCLPFGAIVAVCEVVDCRPHGSFTLEEIRTRRTRPGLAPELFWTEEDMGLWDLGRFGWVLANVRALAEPLPWKGSQGFFDVPDELILSRLSQEPGEVPVKKPLASGETEARMPSEQQKELQLA